MLWLVFVILVALSAVVGLGAVMDVGAILAPLLNRLAKRLGLQSNAKTGDEYCGKEAVVATPINHSTPDGKIELHGSIWSARLTPLCSGACLKVGDIVVIEGIEGLTFLVAPKGMKT